MAKPNAQTFPAGKYGTVVPSDPSKPLASELRLLGRLIGTDSAQGRAEARGIVERAETDLAAILSALRGVLPYAESRLEDMAETVAHAEPGNRREAARLHAKAREAFMAAREILAKAEGRA